MNDEQKTFLEKGLSNLIQFRNVVSHNRLIEIQAGQEDETTKNLYLELVSDVEIFEQTKQALEAVKYWTRSQCSLFGSLIDILDKYFDME